MDVLRATRDRAWVLRRAMTLPEVLLWKAIRGRQIDGFHFRRQQPVGRYVPDFYCDAAKLAVEVDGASHSAADRPERDDARDAWLRSCGIHVLRLPAKLVLTSMDDAVSTIRGWLEYEALRGEAAAEAPSPAALRASGPPPRGEDLPSAC